MDVQTNNHPFIYIGLYHAHNGNITINDHIGNYTFYNKTTIDELNTIHLHLTNPSIYKLNKNLILYNFEIDKIVYIIACRKGFGRERLNWFRKDNISKELSKGLVNDLHKLKLWNLKNNEGLLTDIAEKTLKLAVKGFVKRNEVEKKKKENETDKLKGNEFFYEQTKIDEELFLATSAILQEEVRLEKSTQNNLIQKIIKSTNSIWSKGSFLFSLLFFFYFYIISQSIYNTKKQL